ncbi:MAG TPA: hypothetical protein VFH51_06395 [Myxococcota bacterium]|nr:hypothetical protein [Myxococcota bacterium]
MALYAASSDLAPRLPPRTARAQAEAARLARQRPSQPLNNPPADHAIPPTHDAVPLRPMTMNAIATPRLPTYAVYKERTAIFASRRCSSTKEVDKVVERVLANPGWRDAVQQLQHASMWHVANISNAARRGKVGAQLEHYVSQLQTATAMGVVVGTERHPKASRGGRGGQAGSGWCICLGS